MRKLFGTDGIRGIANQDPVTPETGLRLGRAVVQFCRRRGIPPDVVIGRDTRISGEMLELALAAGVLSAGGNAFCAGPLPTPAVASLSITAEKGMGIVVSASHNPYEYNGFKLFSGVGFKLTDQEETEIEGLMEREKDPRRDTDPGRRETWADAVRHYVDFLSKSVPETFSLEGYKIVLDCAHGATYRAAPLLFQRFRAEVIPLFISPDGRNINRDCGSQHTQALQRKVLEAEADAGLAFDGDGDRLIAVNEKGQPLSGDQILFILARYLKESGALKNHVVVGTVMSNMGLRFALEDLGVQLACTPVGDRHVVQEMRARGAVLGGEESGHIILLEHHTTGDGLLTGLQLLSAMKSWGKSLSDLSGLMTPFPQILLNVPVRERPEIETLPAVLRAIRNAEKRLGERGKVLVRYSGTEPVCRVMVEGEEGPIAQSLARKIANAVSASIGG